MKRLISFTITTIVATIAAASAHASTPGDFFLETLEKAAANPSNKSLINSNLDTQPTQLAERGYTIKNLEAHFLRQAGDFCVIKLTMTAAGKPDQILYYRIASESQQSSDENLVAAFNACKFSVPGKN